MLCTVFWCLDYFDFYFGVLLRLGDRPLAQDLSPELLIHAVNIRLPIPTPLPPPLFMSLPLVRVIPSPLVEGGGAYLAVMLETNQLADPRAIISTL